MLPARWCSYGCRWLFKLRCTLLNMKGIPLHQFNETLSPDLEFDCESRWDRKQHEAIDKHGTGVYQSLYFANRSYRENPKKVPPIPFAKKVGCLPWEVLCKYFSFDEICRLWFGHHLTYEHSQRFTSDMHYDPDKHFVVNKLFLSQRWHWRGKEQWETIALAYNSIRNFNFGDGFEVTVDFPRNSLGWALFDRTTFIDGALGFHIHLKGEHVLTIGFSVTSDRRLLVQQVQLKKSKGNRWLFKLPKDHVSYALDCMAAAFPDFKLHLIVAKSLADQVAQAYRAGGREMAEKDYNHVIQLYSRRLKGWRRQRKLRISRCQFHQLAMAG